MKRILIILLFLPLLAACGRGETLAVAEGAGEAAAANYERGPHRGRMLRDGDFELEVTIFETGVPPQFRLYAYRDGQPLKPGEVKPVITLKRLDGEVNRFTFTPEGDHLTGSGTVHEPHSFDVEVTADRAGETHRWTYASYEGRTTIPAAIAADAGIEVATAGPATIRDSVKLVGRVELDANRHADVKARFPGIVRAVRVQQGERVRRGQTLVVVEGNESMRTYPVTAPFDGVVLARNTNAGDVADDNTLIEMADLSHVWVELQAIGNDAARLAAGQPVHVESATGDREAETVVDTLLPLATRGQSVIVRANLPNEDGRWRPGTTVTAHVIVAEKKVPLAVKESALQRFRDFTVVFAQIGDTYEVRMLELGDRDGEYAEVLGGLKPGTRYVTEQSYLIKADIEKSGATHDH
ncbi:MAG: efflux RND transporter periplasmic adaptor subunit [Xanthomonadales bacterium]|nr:efflux RND transporter periplasmic adaptor subunit [Xanthomonadales bacterium]ODU74333.1 MAG: cation transporter [Rhodanobacter sp. SCN 69-32]OJY84128.1 MAG: HlyD family secretion protein [Xanthomonadales bacterium 66-474]